MLLEMWKVFLRRLIWLVLACCPLLDGALGEAAISGYGDVGIWDENGNFAFPPAQPELWLPIMGLIAMQGVLILALIRLRPSEGPPRLINTDDSSRKLLGASGVSLPE